MFLNLEQKSTFLHTPKPTHKNPAIGSNKLTDQHDNGSKEKDFIKLNHKISKLKNLQNLNKHSEVIMNFDDDIFESDSEQILYDTPTHRKLSRRRLNVIKSQLESENNKYLKNIVHSPFEIWSSEQANDLLKNRHVVFLGDSVQRCAYIDMVEIMKHNHNVKEGEFKNGNKSFFNQVLAASLGWKKTSDNGTSPVMFGNGEEICNSNLQMISDLAESLTLLRNWKDKDILLIDNHRVMHGRKPFSGEKNREVLVSLTA